jgi:cytosol alanyl aminopeptidase
MDCAWEDGAARPVERPTLAFRPDPPPSAEHIECQHFAREFPEEIPPPGWRRHNGGGGRQLQLDGARADVAAPVHGHPVLPSRPRMRPLLRSFALALLALAACGPAAPEPQPPPPPIAVAAPAPPLPVEPPPLGRLPGDAHPTRVALDLRVDPARPRFEGSVDIELTLDRPRDVLWLHGRDLAVRAASVQPEGAARLEARWEQVSPSGVAALRLPSPIGPGRAVVHVEYDAPFGGNDEGAYVLERGGDRYAFTQLEATYARRAFPCFDEPAFKVPFHVTLTVPRGATAVSNAREVSRAPDARDPAWDRVDFAATPPLPSYLVNFAVGPLDVVTAAPIPPSAVRARPLPLRGVATRGRGPELAFALAHTAEIVGALEGYFGSEYPYEKLDLLAVPEKNGAMENAGSVTFAESLLMVDEKRVTVEQRFLFTAVVGHELAHQWFGDLVTMPWWNDVWLNEAFATWMEPRIVGALNPELSPQVRALEAVHEAMGSDGLVSARKIRQEIVDDNDIDSAFDSITYDKGGAVLSMFERWIGPALFQKGIRAYLAAHRFGIATADDLLAALSTAAGRDVAGPFRTFLDQPGLPFIEARLSCDGAPRLKLAQSRFLPVGSAGLGASGEGHLWQIPVCARYADGKQIREACTLLEGRTGELPLPAASCPAWVMPNADAAGYYRWSLGPEDSKKLAQGLGALNERERMSVGNSLTAAFARGVTPAADVLSAVAPLARDSSSAVASTPMEMLASVGRWLEGDPLHERVRAYAGELYGPAFRALGWQPKKGEAEAPARTVLRRSVIEFLALTARDGAVRREAAARGRAYLGKGGEAHAGSGVSPELAGVALQVAAQESGAPFFDALVTALAAEVRDDERRRILAALGGVTAPELAARARELTLDPRVHGNELPVLLQAQLARAETRDATWAFFTTNLDKLLARMPGGYASRLAWVGTSYCDRAHRDELEKLFGTRAAALEGGPRDLAGALENMNLCIARRAAQEPSARAFFAHKKR